MLCEKRNDDQDGRKGIESWWFMDVRYCSCSLSGGKSRKMIRYVDVTFAMIVRGMRGILGETPQLHITYLDRKHETLGDPWTLDSGAGFDGEANQTLTGAGTYRHSL